MKKPSPFWMVLFPLLLSVHATTPTADPAGATGPATAFGSARVDVSAAEHVRPARPEIPARDFLLTDFGAVGDGHTLNTQAFERAIAAVDHAGGGRLIVPAGVFRTLPFQLCSRLDLHLDAGAVIQAPDTFTAAGLPDPQTMNSQAEIRAKVRMPAPLISGRDLHDVALTGPGTIDGNGRHWWEWSERAARAAGKSGAGRVIYPRPNLVAINGCERLYVADLTFTNSPKFHLVPSRVTDLTIERVKVRAPFDAPNTDAIDPGPGTNFLIRDCDLDTGDDDIVIKSGGTNILIEDCTIRHGHGISIGSGTTLGIHDMLVRRCTFDGTDNGIRIKSMRGAGGPVSNLRYTDLRMKNVTNAIVLDMNYVDNNRPDYRGDPTKIPSFHDILIDHVTIEGSRNAGRIVGLPESPIANITLQDVTLSAANDIVTQNARAITYDRVTRTIGRALVGATPPAAE